MTAMPQHNPADLIPHRGNAVLIDEISYIDDDKIETRLVVRPGTVFSDANGDLPAWVGPEVMAQSVAALAGRRSLRARGHLAPIGLLLGIRSYEVTAREFRCGETLQVQVIKSSEDEDGMAVFNGSICHAGEVVASATLTVFQPPDDSFIEAECARDG